MALELSKIRAKLFLKDSFIACVAGQLDWVVSEEETQTAATDGTHIYINEDFFGGLSLAEQLGVIAHEALHVILMHTVRARQVTDVERHAWNIACDMCVKRMVKDKDKARAAEVIVVITKETRMKDILVHLMYCLLRVRKM